MTRKIKGLLFDKDGTLFDFHATWAGWTRDFITLVTAESAEVDALADAFGFDMAACEFLPRSIVIAATPEVILNAAHEALPHLDRGALEQQLLTSSSMVALAEAVPLVPLLDRFLAHDMKLGLATNDLKAVADAHLARALIRDKFVFVAGSDSGHGAKPAPGMQQAFCAATGIAPHRVVMVGDSVHDMVSGRAAGMTTIAVLTGPASADELSLLADATLRDIGEIPEWLGLQRRASNAT